MKILTVITSSCPYRRWKKSSNLISEMLRRSWTAWLVINAGCGARCKLRGWGLHWKYCSNSMKRLLSQSISTSHVIFYNWWSDCQARIEIPISCSARKSWHSWTRSIDSVKVLNTMQTFVICGLACLPMKLKAWLGALIRRSHLTK